ncbi:AMMECR1 domain-containing protein [Natronobacterium gregoryi]|uniref:AMMECR1 domain-containing protein n=2 Tax=Natronobacterium gregoryi TaxID=44930 RepID=L0AJU4_NATGS|nr:AMMECR1 domain-containing protein [Natronobacterium gregoryi]AFZ73457.1 hypothetical protein Natgr_2281 [Natronobacterium gregoryi SP2]ELY68654.1 AMMECR1 domain-containing protein [Natronobacterium gregoryi SP2]PLK20473.1 AMMECR1 domain-containing protein [Natronobacterium gregoryi SP2]SFI71496.1 hypothetical protein/hypothetical protein [Natronobacterium gregoryi]
MLDPDAVKRLVGFARRTVESVVRNSTAGGDETESVGSTTRPLDGEVSANSGAFVTLERGGRLRGCCGRLEHGGPISAAVEIAARQATLTDPRFSPVEPHELETVTVGRHGLVVSSGHG